jgi:serine/threonine protein kinase
VGASSHVGSALLYNRRRRGHNRRVPGPDREFQGTTRFVLKRRLGEGGMGVVWEALDRERLTPVALKTLRTLAPETLLRFKHEFRALQDLAHPNLVSLGELIEEDGQWFFTMELVRGQSLLAWVRPGEPGSNPDGNAPGNAAGNRLGNGDRFDEPRLRAAFAQLATGLAALHARGLVHRDIKPSNVLVAEDGRVVVLDFGVVAEVSAYEEGGGIVGTAAYRAPEQASGGAIGAAADWYAFGAVLHQALTGMLPFAGRRTGEGDREPPPPRRWSAAVPEDLDALTRALLRRDPAARPSGDDVLRQLGASVPLPSPRAPRFVGRAAELKTLTESLASSRQRGRTVLVHGESGVGKSALVQHFVATVAATEPEALVLRGRCYERESVHYKAVDGAIDALTRWLSSRWPDELAALLPRDVALVAELFPVLERVEAVAAASPPADAPEDPPEHRARAFLALRQLLGAIAKQRPLVLAVDDLQWADADSLALLGELMRAPDAPTLLVVATLRADGTAAPAQLLARLGGGAQLALATLSPAEARELAAQLLGGAAGEGPLSAAVIAAEAHGHPLFIDELVRHKLAHGASLANPPLQLDEALRTRVDRLEPDARRLVELVAVAAAPLEQATAAAAAATDFSEFTRLVTELKAQNLVRTSGVHPSDTIEPYHDRVRDAVLRHLDAAARKMRHGRLAMALEASKQSDAQSLALHFAEAGDRERAARYTSLAADEAAQALAFDRAATLYRDALALAPSGSAARQQLAVNVAETLASAGRGAEAARAYQEAAALLEPAIPATAATSSSSSSSSSSSASSSASAPSPSPNEHALVAPPHRRGQAPLRRDQAQAYADARAALALELRRRAAEQYLRGGHVDDGLAAVQAVLGAVGMTLPRTPTGALLSLLFNRARVRLRGLGFAERPEAEVPPALLRRLDTCFSVAVGMGLVDTIRGADYQTRCLLLALRAGEIHRVARALAMEAAHASAAGGATQKRVTQLLASAAELASRVRSPEVHALVSATGGIAAFLQGRWREGHRLCSEAERVFRERCIGAAWEADSAQSFALWSLFYLGEMAELQRRVPTAIREAEERGDLYAATNLRIGELNFVHLASDDIEGARAAAATAMAMWSQQGFHHQHWDNLLAEATIDLYAGDPATAWARVQRTWKPLRKSLLLMIQLTRIEATHLRGRVALALACTRVGAERRRLLKEAQAMARRLWRERMAWSTPLAALLDSGIRLARGDELGARTALTDAVRGFDAADMGLWAACARYKLAPLFGANGGRALEAAAADYFAAQSIAHPGRVVATLAPGTS